MNRFDLLFGATEIARATPLVVEREVLPYRDLAGIRVPDSALARDAEVVAREALPLEIYRHSLRAFLFAELIARVAKVEHDVEAVYVAAMLHDVGLSAAHASDSYRFEIDGANVARDVLARHGVRGARADVVWDAIALHDSTLADWKQAEVRLVCGGVCVDFGEFLDRLERADVAAVLHAAPRDGFVNVFLEAVAAIARRKPFATGSCFVTDVAHRLVPGFSPGNFADAVRGADPFASFG